MSVEILLWAIAAGYTAFVGVIAYAVYQLKLISVILDNQPSIVKNKQFLKNYSFQIRVNQYLEKVWPRVKHAKLSGISSTTYDVVSGLFFALLVLQFFFSDFLAPAAPAMFLSLGFLAIVGNALQDKKGGEAAKYLLLPFSIIFPLFVAYHIDTSDKLLKIKSALTAQGLGYEAVLALLVIGLGLFCYFGISVVERFQKFIVFWVLNRALTLSQNMVLVGVNPTMPEEKEMRAIAKEAIVVTSKNMVIFGLVVSTIVGAIRQFLLA